MAGGFLTQKFSTIFKGPYMLYWKERSESKGLVKMLIKLRVGILKDMNKKVREEHNISGALKLQKKIREEFKKSSDKGYKLAFNVELDQENAVDILQEIEAAWEKARQRLGQEADREDKILIAQLDRQFESELLGVLQGETAEEKDIYWHYLEPVIATAEKKGNSKVIMAQVASAFKTQDAISRLAIIAFRWEARAVRKGIQRLGKWKKQLKEALEDLERAEKKSRDPKKEQNRKMRARFALARLKKIDEMIIKDAKEEFRSIYLLFKRDLLLDMVLLTLLNTEDEVMRAFVIEHLLPKSPVEENRAKLEEIKKEIASHCHVLAQGMRRIIANESNLRKKAGESKRQLSSF